jgi:predicted phosphodiesterase
MRNPGIKAIEALVFGHLPKVNDNAAKRITVMNGGTIMISRKRYRTIIAITTKAATILKTYGRCKAVLIIVQDS